MNRQTKRTLPWLLVATISLSTLIACTPQTPVESLKPVTESQKTTVDSSSATSKMTTKASTDESAKKNTTAPGQSSSKTATSSSVKATTATSTAKATQVGGSSATSKETAEIKIRSTGAGYQSDWEPPVPLSGDGQGSITSPKLLAEKFYERISKEPLLFHFVLYDNTSGKFGFEVLMAFKGKQSYLRYWPTLLTRAAVYVNDGNGKYYSIDQNSGQAQLLPGDEGKALSNSVFATLAQDAKHLTYWGSGKAKFCGQDCEFEEFTNSRGHFLRFYANSNGLIGHRVFDGSREIQSLEIKELSDKVDSALFIVPTFNIQPSQESAANTTRGN